MNIKQNQQVLVSDISEEDALVREDANTKYEYLFTDWRGMHVIKWINREGEIGSSFYAHIIPVPEAKPYTFDTFPLGIVYVRDCIAQYLLVTGINHIGISVANLGDYSYKLAYDMLEISTNLGKTWRKCEVRCE